MIYILSMIVFYTGKFILEIIFICLLLPIFNKIKCLLGYHDYRNLRSNVTIYYIYKCNNCGKKIR